MVRGKPLKSFFTYTGFFFFGAKVDRLIAIEFEFEIFIELNYLREKMMMDLTSGFG